MEDADATSRRRNATPGCGSAANGCLASGVFDLLRPNEAGQLDHRLSRGLGELFTRLESDPVDDQRPRSPVEAGIDSTYDPVAGEDRHRVVTALPLRGRHINLDRVVEVEQLARPVAVRDEVVERREDHRPRLPGQIEEGQGVTVEVP